MGEIRVNGWKKPLGSSLLKCFLPPIYSDFSHLLFISSISSSFTTYSGWILPDPGKWGSRIRDSENWKFQFWYFIFCFGVRAGWARCGALWARLDRLGRVTATVVQVFENLKNEILDIEFFNIGFSEFWISRVFDGLFEEGWYSMWTIWKVNGRNQSKWVEETTRE